MAFKRQRVLAGDPVLWKIDAVRRVAAFWMLGWGYLLAALLAAGLIFAGVLLDHVLLLQKPGRLAFFHVFAFSTAAAALAATLFPLLRRMGRLYVARRMEERKPELKNALISYLQCRDDLSTPREIKRLLCRRALRSIRSLNVAVVVDALRYVRLGAALGAVGLAFLAYASVSPKSAFVSVHRLLRPRADIHPPTAVRLAEVAPGELYVIAGDEPRLHVRTEGTRPDSVCVVWSGQTFEGRRLLLSPKEPNLWEGSFPPVLEDGSYYVVSGDARSEAFGIKVLPPPAVVSLQLDLTPPAYTGVPPRTVSDGNVEVLSGTLIGVRALTNLPPQTGCVEFDSGRRVWLRPLQGESGLAGQFVAVRSDGYIVRFESIRYPNGASFKNLSPVKYRLTCREDAPPVITQTAPDDGIMASPSDKVTLAYKASDDFSVARLRLRHNLNDLISPAVTIAEPRVPRVAEASYEWDLTGTGARRGSVITYYLEAEDNRPGLAQVARSETRRIVIPGVGARPPLPGVVPPSRERPLAQGEAQRAGGAPESRPASPPQERAGEQAATGRPKEGEEGADERRALQEYARRIAELLGREQPSQETGGGEDRPAPAPTEVVSAPAGEARRAEDAARRGPEDRRDEPGRAGPEERASAGAAGPDAVQQPLRPPGASGAESRQPSEMGASEPGGGAPSADAAEGRQPRGDSGDMEPGRVRADGECEAGGSEGGRPSPQGEGPGSGAPRVAPEAGPGEAGSGSGDATASAGVEGASPGGAGQAGASAETASAAPPAADAAGEAGARGGQAGSGAAGAEGQEARRGGEQAGGGGSRSGVAGTPASRDGGSAAGEGARAVGPEAREASGQGGRGRASAEAERASAGAGDGSPAGSQRTAAGGARGTGVTRLPQGGPREGRRRPADPEQAAEELARMIEEDRLPPELLGELGTSREALRDLVARYRKAARAEQEAPAPDQVEVVEEEGRVMEAGRPAAPEMAARDALPRQSARDALKSRFEGASERLSPRYREVVDRYYRMLSEER